MNVNWLMQSEKNLVPPITNNAVSQSAAHSTCAADCGGHKQSLIPFRMYMFVSNANLR